MSVTADKCYNDAAIELDNPAYVSNEWPSHHIGQELAVVIRQC